MHCQRHENYERSLTTAQRTNLNNWDLATVAQRIKCKCCIASAGDRNTREITTMAAQVMDQATWYATRDEGMAIGVDKDVLNACATLANLGMHGAAIKALREAIKPLKTAASKVEHVKVLLASASADSINVNGVTQSERITQINALIAELSSAVSVYNASNACTLSVKYTANPNEAPFVGIATRAQRSVEAHDRTWNQLARYMLARKIGFLAIPNALSKGARTLVEISTASTDEDQILLNPNAAERKTHKYVSVAAAAKWLQSYNPDTKTVEARRWKSFGSWSQSYVCYNDKWLSAEEFYALCDEEDAEAEDNAPNEPSA